MENVNIKLFSPSGTSDYFPLDMKYRNWLLDMWKQVSKEYGFDEYDSSIVEHSDLYTTKGGDDILKEMYSFTMDNIKLCVRPEMTPTLARMVLSKITSETLPIKWFSVPQCYRYENVSSGRRREFYQWNVDSIGGENIKSEFEMFSLIVSFFKKIGLTSENIEICISNRMILQKVLNKMGITDETKILVAFNIVDKFDKLSKNELIERFEKEIGLKETDIEIIFKLTTIKDIKDLSLYLDEKDSVVIELNKLFEMAEKIGIDEWLKFDLSIIRGLSYYTSAVFECFFKNLKMQRAVCEGGRYDNLLKTYGYKNEIVSCGFGMGNIVLFEGLKELKLLPKFEIEKDYLVIPFNEEYFTEAFCVAEKLREKVKQLSYI